MALSLKGNSAIKYLQMNPTISKVDPHKAKERYLKLKTQLIEKKGGLPQQTSDLLLAFLSDMEIGINMSVTHSKGSRSYNRLVGAHSRLKNLFRLLHAEGVEDITKLTEKDIILFLSKIEHGEIRKSDGNLYKSSRDFLRDLKVFWHWHMRVHRNLEVDIPDITRHVAVANVNPDFVHIPLDDLFNFFFAELTFEERVLTLFLYDTIMRAPTEVSNIKVSDIYNNYTEVQIRDEVSKTYGRTITLHLSSEMLRTLVETKCLQPNDYVFSFSHAYLNRKLQKIARAKFGDTTTKGGKPYKDITLYAFRHSGAVHWRLTKYKNNIDALMYRGGWSNLERLNYYTKRVGMSDISQNEISQYAQTPQEQSILHMMQKQQEQIDLLTSMLIEKKVNPPVSVADPN